MKDFPTPFKYQQLEKDTLSGGPSLIGNYRDHYRRIQW